MQALLRCILSAGNASGLLGHAPANAISYLGRLQVIAASKRDVTSLAKPLKEYKLGSRKLRSYYGENVALESSHFSPVMASEYPAHEYACATPNPTVPASLRRAPAFCSFIHLRLRARCSD